MRDQIGVNAAGYVRVKHPTTRTNLKGVFACSDLVSSRYRQAITAAGSAASIPGVAPVPPLGQGRSGGKVSQTTAPPPGDQQNPGMIIISINSVTKHKVGTVRYPGMEVQLFAYTGIIFQ